MHRLPLAYPGMKIGLFGGSFDPAHAGHAHVAETALKRLGLDRVWWLVTPQNPLKKKSAPLAERMASARARALGPQMVVTDLETQLGARYTYETLRALKKRYPGVKFTFVMGEDNLINFRQWRHWREVAAALPFAVVSRPGCSSRRRAGFPSNWHYLTGRHHHIDSTTLRAQKRAAVAKPRRK